MMGMRMIGMNSMRSLAQILTMPACPIPRPRHFPYFRGQPLPPWTPRGWHAPPNSTDTFIVMDTIKLEGLFWIIPGGG
eukprot:40856-Pyramimonas_sp.AAC.1